MTLEGTMNFGENVAREVRGLRGYAVRLTGSTTSADDLMQDTVLRALAAEHQFQVGTHLVAWLTTIMRNHFLSSRQRRREQEDPDGKMAAWLSFEEDHEGHDDHERVLEAMNSLSSDQRNALRMVTVDEVTYEEAALKLGINEGTLKSRVNRARDKLLQLSGHESNTRPSNGGHRTITASGEIREIDVSGFATIQVKSEDPGPVPVLEWLPVPALVVDERYQRDITARGISNVRYIAENFRWSKFTPVIVVPHEAHPGTWYIVDGQHRTYAAVLRNFPRVPCMIIEGTLEEAADAFAAINGRVTQVNELQIHHARVAAGDRSEQLLSQCCAEEGVVIRRTPVPTKNLKPGQTIAVGYVRRILQRRGPDLLRLILRCVMTAHPVDRGVLSGAVLRAVEGVVVALEEDLSAQEFVRRFRGCNLLDMLRRAEIARGVSRRPVYVEMIDILRSKIKEE